MNMKSKMFLISQLIILFLANNLNAQTQGEQELEWAREAFKNNNNRHEYPKYSGEITNPEKNTYKFNQSFITVFDISDETKYLIENGIFHPSIITENDFLPGYIKLDINNQTIKESKQLSIDTLIISNFEYIESLSTQTQKRCRFYLYRNNSINPQLCFVEFTNKDARKETTYKEFIKNCKVTLFETGSILI